MQRRPTKRYWRAYDALYGTIKTEPQQTTLPIKELNGEAKKAVKRKCPKEEWEQCVAVSRITKLGLTVHHSPNGGRRDAREGAKFKRMGTKAGFPDLTFNYARKGYHGLYIEIKPLKGGDLTESQIWWRDHLQKEGYAWYMARGADAVMEIVYDYFGITR